MSGSKILWLQVIAVFGIVIASIWGATEWTAWQLDFQPELGSPWWRSAGFPVYLPPAFFWWWFAYDAYAPEVFLHGAYIVAAGTVAAIIAAIGMSVWRAREAKSVITYGSARWATREETSAAGLLGPDGVLLGKLDRDYLRHDGPEHVLCFAPTRSGKGVGLVVPSLLSWSGSAIVHDIKGENWTLALTPPRRHCRHVITTRRNAGGRAAFRASGGAAPNAAGSNAAPQSTSGDGGGTPAWAQQMRRRQAASQGVSHAAQALRAGDHGGGSASINLSEEK